MSVLVGSTLGTQSSRRPTLVSTYKSDNRPKNHVQGRTFGPFAWYRDVEHSYYKIEQSFPKLFFTVR